MISRIFAWLFGGGISAIGEQMNAAYKAKLDAQNDSERIEADMVIDQLRARQAVIVAEQGSWVTRWIRPAFALVFWIYLAKVIVYDKVLGLGITDPLGGYLEEIMMTIIGAYFLTRPFEKR